MQDNSIRTQNQAGDPTQSNNHRAAPDNFERSRLVDLIEVHQAIAALGQAPDYTAVIEQHSALYDRVRALQPYPCKH